MSMPNGSALGDFASIPIGTNIPTQIAPAQPGLDVTLANQDLTNSVTISRSRNFVIGGGNAVTIPPLGSITVDNTKTIWALAPTGTLPILVFPGGGNWAPSPAQVAAQINTLGLMKDATGQTINGDQTNGSAVTGLISQPTQLYAVAGQTIASGATADLVPINSLSANHECACPYLGYEMQIAVRIGSTSTNPFAIFTVQFFDTQADVASGNFIDQFKWVVPLGSSAVGDNFIFGKGPLRGQFMTINCRNLDATPLTMTITSFILSGVSRSYSRDDWRWDALQGSTPGFTKGSGVSSTLSLLNVAGVTIAAGNSQSRIMSMIAGRALSNLVDNAAIASPNLHCQLQPLPISSWTTANTLDLYPPGNASAATNAFEVFLARCPYLVTWANNGSVSASIQHVITACEY